MCIMRIRVIFVLPYLYFHKKVGLLLWHNCINPRTISIYCFLRPNIYARKFIIFKMPESSKSFSALKKLEIVQFAELNGNWEAGRHFEVAESNIRLWTKNKHLLKGMNQNKRARRWRKEFWPELEKELKMWVMNQRKDGRKVSTVAIKFRAKIITQTNLIENFKTYEMIGKKRWRITNFS